MEDDGLNMQNWVYYEPSFKGQHLNLQLMSNVAERDTKPFLPGRDPNIMVNPNGAFHPRNCMVPEVSVRNHMDYARDSWVNQREKFMNVIPTNHNYSVMPETVGAHSLHMLQPHDFSKDGRAVRIEEPSVEEEVIPSKKRQSGSAPKTSKTKKRKKGPSMPQENGNVSVRRLKPAKKNMDVVINGIDMDISGIPIPICSCTGIPQQCYRWGCGGWQSACCTTSMSMHPLPMSSKRRGARIAGRKMSQGAFKKVLEKLAAEGYNFSNAIDLRTHWAKHGTNKFVTIR